MPSPHSAASAANILDYLDWREDLTLAQDPFNEVDNLILAELSFVDFGGIVPGPGGRGRRCHPRTLPPEPRIAPPSPCPDGPQSR